MSKDYSRRKFIKKAGTAGLALGTGMVAAPYLALGAQPTKLVTGTLAGGWTNIVNGLMIEKKFGAKHNIDFEVFNTYSSVRQYYTDIAYQNALSSADTFSGQYRQGLVDILDLLSVYDTTFNLQAQRVELQNSQLSNRIDLGLALGLGVSQ